MSALKRNMELTTVSWPRLSARRILVLVTDGEKICLIKKFLKISTQLYRQGQRFNKSIPFPFLLKPEPQYEQSTEGHCASGSGEALPRLCSACLLVHLPISHAKTGLTEQQYICAAFLATKKNMWSGVMSWVEKGQEARGQHKGLNQQERKQHMEDSPAAVPRTRPGWCQPHSPGVCNNQCFWVYRCARLENCAAKPGALRAQAGEGHIREPWLAPCLEAQEAEWSPEQARSHPRRRERLVPSSWPGCSTSGRAFFTLWNHTRWEILCLYLEKKLTKI